MREGCVAGRHGGMSRPCCGGGSRWRRSCRQLPARGHPLLPCKTPGGLRLTAHPSSAPTVRLASSAPRLSTCPPRLASSPPRLPSWAPFPSPSPLHTVFGVSHAPNPLFRTPFLSSLVLPLGEDMEIKFLCRGSSVPCVHLSHPACCIPVNSSADLAPIISAKLPCYNNQCGPPRPMVEACVPR